MTARSVQDWFKIIHQRNDGDLYLTRQVLAELEDDNLWRSDSERQRHLLNLFAAIRLDQMSKEVS